MCRLDRLSNFREGMGDRGSYYDLRFPNADGILESGILLRLPLLDCREDRAPDLAGFELF